MVDLRVFGMKRGTTREPGGLSNIDLVIWCSSCSATTKEKEPYLYRAIDRINCRYLGV